MPIKKQINNSLEIGCVYNFEGNNLLVVRSDYERSKAYVVTDYLDINTILPDTIKSFFNVDSTIVARPISKEIKVEKIKVGSLVIQDGLIYELKEVLSDEFLFVDFPKSNCPLYLYMPKGSKVNLLEKFVDIITNPFPIIEPEIMVA
jgi:hypothetical protein